jgi:hypothetical protein
MMIGFPTKKEKRKLEGLEPSKIPVTVSCIPELISQPE